MKVKPKDQSFCLIVPCYNESNRLNLDAFLDFFVQHPNGFCLFVNDGSTDNTKEIIEAFVQDKNNFSSLSLDQNLGKGEAVRYGFNWAIQKSFPIVAFWDADLSTPLIELIRMINHINEGRYLWIFGSRIKTLDKNIQRKIHRHYIGRFFATFISIFLKIPLYDSQCGAKCFYVTPELKSILKNPFITRWLFDVELILRMQNHMKIKDYIYEMPLNEWTETPGGKITLIDGFVVLLQIIKLSIKK